MRQPYEVLVFPFKKEEGRYIFAIFHRRRLKVWQGIAEGEEGETILETAKREANEEAIEYLKWDRNRKALWELNERLSKK